jgi:hypothetical protein
MTVNPDWAKLPLFERKGWKRVRFSDVAENLNETERDPAVTGIERFIAMEPLEPGSLHVREWGNVADGATFTPTSNSTTIFHAPNRACQNGRT